MATKTGGSLLGRADNTLVQGALKAELANVGSNMQGVYQMQVENVTNLQTAVQDFFYAFDKSNLDLQNEVKELTPKLLADIETGTYIDDSYVDLVSQEINSLRQQMKSIPRGREGEAQRAKIKTRLANIKAESGSAEQTMTKIATLIDNDQIDFNSLQTGDMELWKSILDKTAKREFVDGKLVYSANINGKELKISHSDLEKRFLPKQYGVQSNALKLSNGFINVGKQGLDYDFNGAVNAYEALMTNKQEVLGLINNPFGSMQYSFKDALKGKDPKLVGELLGALNRIGGFNVEGDERPDQITMSNLNKLVSTLTNPDDDNFNLATTKRVAAAFYADNDGRTQHSKGKSLYDLAKRREQEESDEKTNTYAANMNLGGGVNTNTLISYINDLESGTIINPRDGQKYSVNDDNSWTNESGKTISGNDMVNALQYFEFEKQGYTFDDEGKELTKGSKRPYMFVSDVQFKPFLGTSVKQNEQDFLPTPASTKDVEVRISEQKNYSQVVNTINDILKDYKIDSSKNAKFGKTFSRNTITFDGQKYDLSGYFMKNKNEKQKQEGEQNLKDLIAAVQAFVGGRELP